MESGSPPAISGRSDYVGEGVEIIAVVKADAYGISCAGSWNAHENGINRLGAGSSMRVAARKSGGVPSSCSATRLLSIRAAGRKRPANRFRVEQAEPFPPRRKVEPGPAFNKLDTGMRLGSRPPASRSAVRTIAALPAGVEGIYTHCPFTNERGRGPLPGGSFAIPPLCGHPGAKGLFIPRSTFATARADQYRRCT